MKLTKRLASAALAAALAMSGLALRADTFVKDVMVIGGDKETVNGLKASLADQGWTLVNKDLNANCGPDTDWIYLLYKGVEAPGGNSCYDFVTGFYLLSGNDVPNSISTSDGTTYYLAPCQGSAYFVSNKGDLNSHANGDTIHLYYTKSAVSPECAVNGRYSPSRSRVRLPIRRIRVFRALRSRLPPAKAARRGCLCRSPSPRLCR